MPYMNFKDLNMFYEDMGCGEPILFLHSHFSRSLLAFGAQIQPFQGEYRCLFPDFRGHGRTKCESLEWDSRKIADDMAGFLDALEIPSAHLLPTALEPPWACIWHPNILKKSEALSQSEPGQSRILKALRISCPKVL